ncbi:DUF5058 family protein [Finegoldia magna]|uniref:DUF5058 family protein n=1 Tax=Finegoldia magna TaxID=1260 RepID=A0A233VBK1_FINMA|nr:DUF5058 family protein [Finegoldia magna]EGS35446.1 putative membrane protein [Finegoldia magna SY403409CC001050417]MDU5808894.1 DUF5058 family protein [Finegoldia magna]MDU6598360.1 DUF5058 family protein [Finegoldia magna]MDU7140665.1 DUF5058 family protein [Finegoldia magna]MDU7164584.1 DUF5058 family protein [Finegoldia magna]
MDNQFFYANHPLMYIACSVGILLVLFQATVVLKKTIKCAKEKGMDEKKIKKGITTSAISSIGPALGIVGSILALIVSLGAPVTALRMSVIGGTNYETMAANFGAKALGSELSTKMDPVVFANALWVPALGVMGWLIIMFFFGHRMDKINNLLTGGRKALLPAVSVGAMLGAFAYFNIDNLMKITVKPQLAASTISGFIIMVICQLIGKKVNWIKQWSLTFAMFGGAIIASFFM